MPRLARLRSNLGQSRSTRQKKACRTAEAAEFPKFRWISSDVLGSRLGKIQRSLAADTVPAPATNPKHARLGRNRKRSAQVWTVTPGTTNNRSANPNSNIKRNGNSTNQVIRKLLLYSQHMGIESRTSRAQDALPTRKTDPAGKRTLLEAWAPRTRRPRLAALRPWTDPVARKRQIGELVWRHPLHRRVGHRILIPGFALAALPSTTTN